MVSKQGRAKMKKVTLAATILLSTITTPLQAQKAWVVSDESLIVEKIESRYGCAAIVHIEWDWHNIYTKNGCQNFFTTEYGYAIEQVQKELKKLGIHEVYIETPDTDEFDSGTVINNIGKYKTHITLTFLKALGKYKNSIYPKHIKEHTMNFLGK